MSAAQGICLNTIIVIYKLENSCTELFIEGYKTSDYGIDTLTI